MGLIDDPIVAEIRAARERIAAECDYDIHKLYERGCEVLGVVRRAGGVVQVDQIPVHPDYGRTAYFQVEIRGLGLAYLTQ